MGATNEIRAVGQPRYTVTFAGDAAMALSALAKAGVRGEPAGASDGLLALRFATDDPRTTNTAVLRSLLDADIRVVTLAAEERSLEEAYMAILADVRT